MAMVTADPQDVPKVESFAFTPENLEKAKGLMAQYPAGRQASAVIGLLYLALHNLADNAVRYSPPLARVELQVSQADGLPTLQVDDAGPGIPPAERERVFDRFYRRGLADEPGTGLGLAIVRSVAQRHGATVALGDSPLGGLRVTLRFAAHA